MCSITVKKNKALNIHYGNGYTLLVIYMGRKKPEGIPNEASKSDTVLPLEV